MSSHVIAPEFDRSAAPKTLAHMLRRAGEYSKNEKKIGVYYVNPDRSETFQSYGDLVENATRIYWELRNIGINKGDKLMLQIRNEYNFLNVFWACILGGIIPVPLTVAAVTMNAGEAFAKVLNVSKQVENPRILTEYGLKDVISRLNNERGDEFPNIPVFYVEDLNKLSPEETAKEIEDFPKEEDLAFLQYSSGSTGSSKGVMLTHYNLISNVYQLINRHELTTNDFYANWMPLTHDMGLICFHMPPIGSLASQFKMRPDLFVKDCSIYLEKISKFKATVCGGPNFAVSWLTERIPDEFIEKLDLSSLKIVMNGAEPISAPVAREFNKKYEKAKLNPNAMYYSYGMAEACVGITLAGPLSEPISHKLDREVFTLNSEVVDATEDSIDTIEFADCASPLNGMELKILDEQDTLLDEDQVGNLVVKGPNVTTGYYNNPEANEDLFTADGFLRTGDIGFIRNGRFTITGRKKDVIFVNGQNYYSHDLEAICWPVAGVTIGCIAVIGANNPRSGNEEIAAFVIFKKSMGEFVLLHEEIMKQVNKEIGVSLNAVIPVRQLQRTTSGKLQRFKLREDFKKGFYNEKIKEIKKAVEEYKLEQLKNIIQPTSELEFKIRKAWAEVLRMREERIGVEHKFLEIGGNSLRAIRLLALLEKIAGTELPQEVLIKCHTIQDIADYLSEMEKDDLPIKDYIMPEAEKEAAGAVTGIAVTGIGAIFPRAYSTEEFWNNLVERKVLIESVSGERKALAGVSEWEGWMALIQDVDKFDAGFFGMSAEEANVMDPQQRLMLEAAYQAFEDGGIASRLKNENNIGVYIGASVNSYLELVVDSIRKNGIDGLDPHVLPGNIMNMVAATVSHIFNLKGPAMTIDTACSSSLVALDHAVSDLQAGKIDYALAGGANLVLSPSVPLLCGIGGILSPGNRCKVFDAGADGTVLGETVAVVLLQPLATALKNNSKIYGVIKGIATNNDGSSFGIMTPNPKGQFKALVDAYKDANIDPGTLSYVEAHGTGTVIGDPVEVRGLNQLFKEFSDKKQFCGIGSVKSNIGHSLAAAGMAGLIKTLLCLKNKKLIPNLPIDKINPFLEIEDTAFFPVTEVQDWKPVHGNPRRAGVSSYGIGGTNAHVVLEEYTGTENAGDGKNDMERGLHLLTVSGKDEEALRANISNLKSWIEKKGDMTLPDISYTRNVFREHFFHRKAFVVKDLTELRKCLGGQGDSSMEKSGFYGKKKPPKLAFLCSGAGDEYVGMGENLYTSQPVFKDRTDKCANALKPLLKESIDIRSILCPQNADERAKAEQVIHEEWLALPLVFVVSYALGEMWKAFGIKPNFITGHGIGEYTAACLAEVMAVEEALTLVAGIGRGDLDAVNKTLKGMKLSEPLIPFISGIRGNIAKGTVASPDYWIDQLKNENDFKEGAVFLEEKGCMVYLEVGPGEKLKEFTMNNVIDRKGETFLISIDEGVSQEWETVLESIAEFYVSGFSINWENFDSGYKRKRVDLPTYAFNKKSYWIGRE
ncbi:MAG: AMP-binding protein [bacterium]|nr:AMP-binding protein [bacterium]